MSELQASIELGIQDRELVGLLARTAQGDEAALGALYDLTSAQVYGLALRVLHDHATAEEVTLDVYMQVWQQASKFDQSRGKPIVWLTMLTRSRAIDRLRSGHSERERQEALEVADETGDAESDPEASTVQSEQRVLVQQALASLTPEQREAIELAYFEGLSQSEIAAKIGQPLGTVKTRIRLGMIRLRNILSSFEEGLTS